MTPEEMQHLAEAEQLSRENTRRLDRLEARLGETERLGAVISALQAEQAHIKDGISEIKDAVRQLTQKPAKRWDLLVEQTILCLLSGLLATLVARFV